MLTFVRGDPAEVSACKWVMCPHAVQQGPSQAGAAHLGPEAPVQPAGDHAPGVGLHGEHGPEAVAEGLAHQVGAAAGLELDDAPAGQAVLLVQPPGAVQGLQPQETQPHLQGQPSSEPWSQGGTALGPLPLVPQGTSLTLWTRAPGGQPCLLSGGRFPGVALAPVLRPGAALLPVCLPSSTPGCSPGAALRSVAHTCFGPSEVSKDLVLTLIATFRKESLNIADQVGKGTGTRLGRGAGEMAGAGWGTGTSCCSGQPTGQVQRPCGGRSSPPREAHQPIVPPAVVAPPVPLDQSSSVLQLQEVGPETAGDPQSRDRVPRGSRVQVGFGIRTAGLVPALRLLDKGPGQQGTPSLPQLPHL